MNTLVTSYNDRSRRKGLNKIKKKKTEKENRTKHSVPIQEILNSMSKTCRPAIWPLQK